MDLQRKQNLPANKLANLMAKFDEVKNGGNMMPTATLAMGTMEGKNSDVTCRDFLVNDENICQRRHKCCAVISNSKVCIRGETVSDKSVSTSLRNLHNKNRKFPKKIICTLEISILLTSRLPIADSIRSLGKV